MDEAASTACSERHALTKDYMLQQTMLRVKDPSDPKLLPCCSAFTFYSLGYEDKADTPADVKERTVWTFSRRATLELTQYVWKQPSDADLSYHNGNNEPFVKKPETGRRKGLAFVQDRDLKSKQHVLPHVVLESHH
uniref:Glyoxalase 1 n=1 Tax=Pundamilia nyererei TaxID=303518 RepID=A0A3B4F1K7_9CICH